MSGAPRALVVAYDFPPHGAIGTMRTLRVVRRLHADGWDVTVLTGTVETFAPGTPIERDLLRQVPDGVRVLRAPVRRPIARLQSLIRGNRTEPSTGAPRVVREREGARKPGLLHRSIDFIDALASVPDNESGWIAPAFFAGLRHMARHGRPDVLYSSAPPWTVQTVALGLARVARRPWVADFRDPWARAPWRDWRHPLRQRAAAALERRVLCRADAIQFVTRANRDEYAACYGAAAADRFHLVPNGCDPSEFEALHEMGTPGRFVLLHAGTLYGARNPLPFLRVIARAIDRGAVDRRSFRLRLVGNISLKVDLVEESRRLGIGDVVELPGRVSRAESLAEMARASALLLVQPGTTVSVPGKAYEYLAVGKPVLALTAEGETAELVRASGIGFAVAPDDEAHMEEALLATIRIASARYTRPPRALYDGNVHAATTAALLKHYAQPTALDPMPGREERPRPSLATAPGEPRR